MTVSSTDIASLVNAVKADPSDKVSRLVLADAYEERGETEEAAEQRALASLTTEDRGKALASYLGVTDDEFLYDNRRRGFSTPDGEDYLVLTDDEADARAREEVLNSLWVFGGEYLADYIPVGNRKALVKAIKAIQKECSEDANEVLTVLLGSNLDDLVDSAVSAEGRGHFLAGYDHNENEVSYNGITLYIYRVN